jgi:3-hydroxyisobutyrate dehydrogenase-like beta-hydroxyacid dehydrogenase
VSALGKVGFIGLGNIGLPMARHLLGRDYGLVVFDAFPQTAAELVDKGATLASSCAELASQCHAIGVCVRDDDDVRAVMLAADGVLSSATAGTIVAIHSTIHPRTVEQVAHAARAAGVDVLDAPITGGAFGAEKGTLCYMVGGEAAVLERYRPIFEASAKAIVHTGPLGSGSAVKLCNNLVTYQTFLAGIEGALLARELGIKDGILEEVGRANGIIPESVQMLIGMRRAIEDDPANEGLQQFARNFTTLAEKDLRLALEVADEHGLALPGGGLCKQLMARVYGWNDPKRR